MKKYLLQAGVFLINIGILCSLFTGCKREETTKTETNLPEGLSSVPLARRLASYQTTERGFGKIPNDYHFPHSYTTYWVNQMRRLWGLTETRPHWPIDTFGALRTDLFYIISQTYQLTEDQKEKLIWEMEKYPEFQKLYQEPLENCIWDLFYLMGTNHALQRQTDPVLLQKLQSFQPVLRKNADGKNNYDHYFGQFICLFRIRDEIGIELDISEPEKTLFEEYAAYLKQALELENPFKELHPGMFADYFFIRRAFPEQMPDIDEEMMKPIEQATAYYFEDGKFRPCSSDPQVDFIFLRILKEQQRISVRKEQVEEFLLSYEQEDGQWAVLEPYQWSLSLHSSYGLLTLHLLGEDIRQDAETYLRYFDGAEEEQLFFSNLYQMDLRRAAGQSVAAYLPELLEQFVSDEYQDGYFDHTRNRAFFLHKLMMLLEHMQNEDSLLSQEDKEKVVEILKMVFQEEGISEKYIRQQLLYLLGEGPAVNAEKFFQETAKFLKNTEDDYRLSDAYLLAFLIAHEANLQNAAPDRCIKLFEELLEESQTPFGFYAYYFPDKTYSFGFDSIYYGCYIQYLLDHDFVPPQWSPGA